MYERHPERQPRDAQTTEQRYAPGVPALGSPTRQRPRPDRPMTTLAGSNERGRESSAAARPSAWAAKSVRAEIRPRFARQQRPPQSKLKSRRKSETATAATNRREAPTQQLGRGAKAQGAVLLSPSAASGNLGLWPDRPEAKRKTASSFGAAPVPSALTSDDEAKSNAAEAGQRQQQLEQIEALLKSEVRESFTHRCAVDHMPSQELRDKRSVLNICHFFQGPSSDLFAHRRSAAVSSSADL